VQEFIGTTGGDRDGAIHHWKHVFDKHKRATAKYCLKKRMATLERARVAVAAGHANNRVRMFAQNGGHHQHESYEAAGLAHEASMQAANDRASAEWLAFKVKHVKGCSVPGCDLGPGKIDAVLLCLFDYVRAIPGQPTLAVFTSRGAAREEVAAKTACKCLWHHFSHTASEQNYQPVSRVRDQGPRDIARIKEARGCQHPLHATMPYSALVRGALETPSGVGFLDVSHVTRGRSTRRLSHHERIDDLATGAAVVHCKFCHRLYTLCEAANLTSTDFTRQQFELLSSTYPKFVDHFNQATAGFDWAKERDRVNQEKSAGRARAKRSADGGDEHLFVTKKGKYTNDEERRLSMCL
jgi:hypothetical protein